VRRYLNDDERKYLDDLSQLAQQKDRIDLHYTLQGAMKRWLLVHVPLTVALMVLSFWHLLVVNVYSL
jgi:peptidoglycan biosynthesis protein MviN/MurJ (putative lipid II flippase)